MRRWHHLDLLTLVRAFCVMACAGVPLLACESTAACEASLSVDDAKVAQKAKTKALALSAVCLEFCVQHDPLLDGKYRVWKAAGGKRSGSRAQDIENVAPLKRIRDECQTRCQTEQAAAVQYQNCPS